MQWRNLDNGTRKKMDSSEQYFKENEGDCVKICKSLGINNYSIEERVKDQWR